MDIQSVNNSIGLNNVFLTQKPVDGPVYSMSNLGKVLQKKLKDQAEKKQVHPHHPTKTSEDLQAFSKKMKRLQLVSQQVEKTQDINEEGRREFQSELYFKKFTLANQETYVAQHNEFVVHELIRNSFQPLQGEQKKLKRFMKQKMNGYLSQLPKYENQQSFQQNVTLENRRKYFQFVANKVNNDQQMELGDQINLIKDRKFWEILRNQIKQFDKALSANESNPEIAIVKACINMLNTQFRLTLPQNKGQINNFMISKYMNQNKIQTYQKNQQEIYEWAVVFAYLRAGKFQQLYSALTRMGDIGVELREAITNFEQRINCLQPAPENIVEGNINDPFYQQILYILKGQVKYADRKLAQPGTLDLVWIILHFYKLFLSMNSQRQKDYKIILHKLKQNIMENSNSIKNPHQHFLYLSAYPELIEFFENTYEQANFNEDDFIHFLLVLSDKSDIIKKQERRIVQEKVRQRLQIYIKKLLNTQPQMVPFYMVLLPSYTLKQSLLKIVQNFSEFSKIQNQKINKIPAWDYILSKQKNKGMEEQFYESFSVLMKKLMRKEANNQNQFLLIKTCQRILGAQSKNMAMIITHGFFSHLLVLQDHEKKNNWENRHHIPNPNQYIKQYRTLLSSINQKSLDQSIEFLKNYSQLLKILTYSKKKDKISELRNFLQEEKYMKKENGLLQLSRSIINEEAYILIFNYVRMVQTANQLVNSARGNYMKIVEFKRWAKFVIENSYSMLGDKPGYSELLTIFD